MICGRKLNRIFLALLLLSALSLPTSWADDLPDWVTVLSETEAKTALVESVTRLETTTNELDRSLNLNDAWKIWSVRQSELLDNAMTLNAELLTQRKQDAERFKTIETSFQNFADGVLTELRQTRIENWILRAVVIGEAGLIIWQILR